MFSSGKTQRVKTARAVFSFVLSFVLATSMAGCKISYTLTEHIEDPENGIVDRRIDPLYQEAPNAEPDPTRASTMLSDSDRLDNQTAELPNYSSETQSETQTDQREKDETPHDQNATKGTEESEKDDGDSDNVSEGEETSDQQSGSGNDNSTGSTESPQKESGEGDISPDVAPNGGGGGSVTVVDPSGESMEVPEAGTIAAVGQYAYIVEMIGGKGALSGTSQEFKDEVAAKGIFPGEGIESQPVVFVRSGVGGYTYSIDVDVLINESTANVIITDGSVAALTEEQEEQIKASGRGITILPLSSLGGEATSDATVTEMVSTVADSLQNSPYIDAAAARQRATDYAEDHKIVINDLCLGSGGYAVKKIAGETLDHIYQESYEPISTTSSRISTAYVNGWASAVVTQINASQVRNTYMTSTSEIIDASYGVALSLYSGARPDNDAKVYALIDYYLQVAGVVNMAYETEWIPGKPALVAPGFAGEFMGTSESGYHSWNRTGTSLWYPMDSDSSWIHIGTSEFPAILVSEEAYKTNIKNSAKSSSGLYNVGTPYYVWIVPTGVSGQWSTGTPESFLLAGWALYMFQNGADISEFCTNFVDPFYQEFYRVGSGAYESLIENLHQTDDLAGE